MKYLSLLTLSAAFFLTSCSKSESTSAADPRADSMKTAYRALTQAWDDGKQDEFDKYMAADYKSHNAMPGYDGLEGAKKMSKELKAGFPDMKTNIEDLRVDGDIIMARSRMTGTNSGAMMGGPATNKKMDVIGLEMTRWQNGKFVESWFAMEDMKMMQQLGMMPSMGAPPTDSTKKPM
jgi:predicted ester cyclase